MMPRLGAAEVPIGVAAVTAAVRSQFEDRGAAALLQCAAQVIGAAIAATAIGATVWERQRSARLPLALLRTAAVATIITETIFAPIDPYDAR